MAKKARKQQNRNDTVLQAIDHIHSRLEEIISLKLDEAFEKLGYSRREEVQVKIATIMGPQGVPHRHYVMQGSDMKQFAVFVLALGPVPNTHSYTVDVSDVFVDNGIHPTFQQVAAPEPKHLLVPGEEKSKAGLVLP